MTDICGDTLLMLCFLAYVGMTQNDTSLSYMHHSTRSGHHAPVSSAHTKDPQHTLPPWWLHYSVVTLGRPVRVLAIVIVYRCLFVDQCLLFTCATNIVFVCVVAPEPVFENKSALWTCNCLPPVFIVRDRQNPKRGLTIAGGESRV